MSAVRYRHWQAGDDDGVMRILGPHGWCPPERYAAKFDDPGLRPRDVLIAEQDGRIIGHLMLPHRRLCVGTGTLRFGGVGMVVVDEAARGQGIGAALLRAGLAHHRAAGNVLAGLFTLPSLMPAYAMYEKYGFTSAMWRAVLRVPTPALPRATTGLTARPATEADRPALRRLLASWAVEHAGVSVEAGDAPIGDSRVVVRPDGEIVGRLEVVDRPEGRQVRGGLLAAPGVPVPAVLAAGLAGETASEVRVGTNVENRVYAELAALAATAGPAWSEDRDGFTLMLTCTGFRRLLATLSVELASRLRASGAAPVRVALALAGSDERVAVEWDGRVLLILSAPPDDPAIEIDPAALVRGLMGQDTAAPVPALADLWAALCPAGRAEMRLVDCW
ncbi:MAG: GNAT family N-acetyltransferase [Chloroflexi bacterium]|nr:GNAT family N-acetyltransferase [Chloroflexota bacterium]